MGKRSTTSTKSGKFMNPTDQARKEQRRKELKKNKKQRMAVRHAVLKGKDAQKILTDLDELDDMELNPTRAPILGEKVIKDKRKKLLETFDRVMKLYEKEEPELYLEFRELFQQYQERRGVKQKYYDEVKSAERVTVDDIPLPEAPLTAPLAPYDIPLPQPKSILKKVHIPAHSESKRKIPGPPPGPPPPLSDSDDDEEQSDTPAAKKSRSIRFKDESDLANKTKEDEEEEQENTTPAKPITPLQAAMLKMAAEKAAKIQAQSKAAEKEEEVFAEHGNIKDVVEEDDEPNLPDSENSDQNTARSTRAAEPVVYRGPGGAPVIGLPPAGIRPPGGMLPPGPPPGLPPAMRMHRLPPALPPRLVRPPMVILPPGMRPGMPQSNVLSAPPSIMKPPTHPNMSKDSHATISAKPVIKHHMGEVTRFMPTSLKVKREGQKKPASKPGVGYAAPHAPGPARQAPAAPGQTKDDAYEMFMKEISGIM